MAMTFASLSLIQFSKAYAVRSERHPVWERAWSNKWLNLAVGWELVLLAAILRAPFLQGVFTTSALDGRDWLMVLAAALSVLPVMELAKAWSRRGQARGRPNAQGPRAQ